MLMFLMSNFFGNPFFVSPDLATYRDHFGRRRRRRFPCPERNFVITGPHDSNLGMHASGNDSNCSAPEP